MSEFSGICPTPTQVLPLQAQLNLSRRKGNLDERVDAQRKAIDQIIPREHNTSWWPWRLLSYCGQIPLTLFWPTLNAAYEQETKLQCIDYDLDDEMSSFTMLECDPEANDHRSGINRACVAAGGLASKLTSAPVTTLRNFMFGRMPDWFQYQHSLGLNTILAAVNSNINAYINPKAQGLSSFQNSVYLTIEHLRSPFYNSSWDKHESFVFQLRQSCLQWKHDRANASLSSENTLLKHIIEARFLGNHIHGFCHELLSQFRDVGFPEVAKRYNLPVQQDEQQAMPIVQRLWLFFLAVKHAPPELKGPTLQRVYDSFCGEFNYYFDPHKWGNIPFVLYEVGIKQGDQSTKTVANVRMGTPTQQADGTLPNTANASVIPEFRQFLEFYKEDGKHHLYVNLQNLVHKNVHGDESARCAAIQALGEDFPKTFSFVTLSKDSDFYHQRNDFTKGYPVEVFFDAYIDSIFSGSYPDIYLSHKLDTKKMRGWMHKIMQEVKREHFPNKTSLNSEERRLFAQYYHCRLTELFTAFQDASKDATHLYLPLSTQKIQELAAVAPSAPTTDFVDRVCLAFMSSTQGICPSRPLRTDKNLHWLRGTLRKILEDAEDEEVLSLSERSRALGALCREFREHLMEKLRDNPKGLIFLHPRKRDAADTAKLFCAEYGSPLFFRTFLHQLFEAKDSGYFFPAKIATSEFKVRCLTIMEEVWQDVYKSKAILDKEERKDFIEIFYARLLRHLIISTDADSYNASCKDCIDRGAGANSLFYWYQQLLEDRQELKEVRDNMVIFTLAPALLVRQRHIISHRLDRLTNAMKRLCSSKKVLDRLRAREELSPIQSIQVRADTDSSTTATCKSAQTLDEYRSAFQKENIFEEAEIQPNLVESILSSSVLQENIDGFPQQFRKDIERSLITMNGQRYKATKQRSVLSQVQRDLNKLLGEDSPKIRELQLLASQALLAPVALSLYPRFMNPDLGIGLVQANEMDPPVNINLQVSKSQQGIYSQAVFKIFCTDDVIAQRAIELGKAFEPIYIRATLQIDLALPEDCTVTYSRMDACDIKSTRKDFLVEDLPQTFENLWHVVPQTVN